MGACLRKSSDNRNTGDDERVVRLSKISTTEPDSDDPRYVDSSGVTATTSGTREDSEYSTINPKDIDQPEDDYLEPIGASSRKHARSKGIRDRTVREKASIKLPKHPKVDLPDYKVAVAFDFGTTFSGYAYSYREKPNEIHMNKHWGGEFGKSSYKAPTTVCFNSQGQFESFGYEAHAQYQDEEVKERKGLQLYQRFKMQLHQQREKIYGEAKNDISIESDYGEEMSGKKVFSAALEYLKDHFLKVVTDAGSIKNKSEVLWVLTVPAIWSEQEKMFMKECAVQAGMIDSPLSGRLMIALEPEAASYDCRTGFNEMKPGEKYMIVDAGGGTVDITVHLIQRDNSSKEVHSPSGGPWGGNTVNSNFEKILVKQLGVDIMNQCKASTPSGYFEQMLYFESAKTVYKFDKPLAINIDMAFANAFEKKKKAALKDFLKNTKDRGIWMSDNGKLRLSADKVKECFDQSVNNILKHVEELLQKPEVDDVNKIFLVGGFAGSIYLQEKFKDKFQQDYHIHIPEEPGISVLNGAVLFAHRPDFITSRIATQTYALLNHSNPVAPALYPIIKKGESVEINTFEETYALPAEDHLTNVEIELYTATGAFNADPASVNNQKIATVAVNLPRDVKDRLITIRFIFGGTDLRVIATNSQGKSQETTLKYIHN